MVAEFVEVCLYFFKFIKGNVIFCETIDISVFNSNIIKGISLLIHISRRTIN